MRQVVIFRDKVYDPDTLTVKELKTAGLDPLAGASGPVLLGLCLMRDYPEEEVERILEHDTEVSDMEVRVTVSEKPNGTG